jgi:NAD(P)-dependent dehydrogenase (short-subunit alcohol dehydrogenase family)
VIPIDLSGRVAIVTGGSEGIGRGIAEGLVRAGADVLIVARRPEPLAAAQAELLAVRDGARVEVFAGDAGDPELARACVGAAVERLGGASILVNNAPGGLRKLLLEVEAADMEHVFRMTQVAAVLWTQAAWRGWMGEHGGAIVNIGAAAAERVERGLGFYGANKAAVVRLTRQLAAELAPDVRVNAVSPGWVWSKATERTFATHGPGLEEILPAGRLGRPEDIANMVVFLVSDLAAWVTGEHVMVDGGALAAHGLFTRVVGR